MPNDDEIRRAGDRLRSLALQLVVVSLQARDVDGLWRAAEVVDRLKEWAGDPYEREKK
jgi:hypothetical protein